MKISKSTAYALGVCAAAALFVGCSSGSQSSGPVAVGLNPGHLGSRILGRPSLVSISFLRGVTPHADHRKSWISPDIKRIRNILFVSDAATGDVYLYSQPGLALKGVLTGFSSPEGLCSDNSGNIWVANVQADQMVLLAHSGKVIRYRSQPKVPISCAIDPTTSNLAVAIDPLVSGTAEILIYPFASGMPKSYTDANVSAYQFLAYDPNGNLFVDGYDSSVGNFILLELPKNATSLRTVSITGGTINYPGSLEWYTPENYLLVGDMPCGSSSTACAHRVAISGSVGSIFGVTNLLNSSGGPTCTIYQQVLTPGKAMKIAGSDYDTCGGPTSTYVWSYPAGGFPTSSNSSVDQVPAGAAISSK